MMYREKAPNDGHRKNILNRRYTDVGVAVLLDTVHHRLWLTVDFGTDHCWTARGAAAARHYARPMPRRPLRAVPVVVVPGWNGSGAGHWQTWLEGELRAAGRQTSRPDVADWDVPDLAGWLAALRDVLAPLLEDGFDVVTHSLGALLWLHHAADPVGPRPARVALVAPPSPGVGYPEIADFLPPPLDLDAVRAAADGTVLVGGTDDQHCPEGIAAAYGVPLKMATTVVDGGGHLNTGSGYGEWPAMLSWCNRDNLAFY